MIRPPLDRLDAAMLATFVGATGVDHLARATVPPASAAAPDAPARFVDQAVATFTWSGAEVYITATDAIALASGAIFLVRFLAWASSPLASRPPRNRRTRNGDPRPPSRALRDAPPPPFVLGITGPGGAGKSAVARALVALRPRVEILHAGFALKAMLRGFYTAAGLSEAETARRIDGDLKRTPCPLLCDRTPTEAQQTLGTDWGREMIGRDLWLGRWRDRARAILADGGSVINDSVRFDDEAATIRALGGLVVRLTGRADPLMPAHVSESGVVPDLEIANTGAPEDAARAILGALQRRL
jgi:hypothetical protein